MRIPGIPCYHPAAADPAPEFSPDDIERRLDRLYFMEISR